MILRVAALQRKVILKAQQVLYIKFCYSKRNDKSLRPIMENLKECELLELLDSPEPSTQHKCPSSVLEGRRLPLPAHCGKTMSEANKSQVELVFLKF